LGSKNSGAAGCTANPNFGMKHATAFKPWRASFRRSLSPILLTLPLIPGLKSLVVFW